MKKHAKLNYFLSLFFYELQKQFCFIVRQFWATFLLWMLAKSFLQEKWKILCIKRLKIFLNLLLNLFLEKMLYKPWNEILVKHMLQYTISLFFFLLRTFWTFFGLHCKKKKKKEKLCVKGTNKKQTNINK